LIDWPRVHQRDLRDLDHTILALQFEHVRHEFWCTVPFSARAEDYARRRGKRGILVAARQRIRSSVGKPMGIWDSRQTPWENKGHALHYGQHATATCCRKCIQVWHGIPRDQELNDKDIEYFSQLLLRYVVHRLPDLGDDPVHVPRRVHKQSEDQLPEVL
jgi:hypothetical protein